MAAIQGAKILAKAEIPPQFEKLVKFYVIADCSSSMSDSALAIEGWVESMKRQPYFRLFDGFKICSFGTKATPFENFSDKPYKYQNLSCTNLDDALQVCEQEIGKLAPNERDQAVVVILTDGDLNGGDKNLTRTANWRESDSPMANVSVLPANYGDIKADSVIKAGSATNYPLGYAWVERPDFPREDAFTKSSDFMNKIAVAVHRVAMRTLSKQITPSRSYLDVSIGDLLSSEGLSPYVVVDEGTTHVTGESEGRAVYFRLTPVFVDELQSLLSGSRVTVGCTPLLYDQENRRLKPAGMSAVNHLKQVMNLLKDCRDPINGLYTEEGTPTPLLNGLQELLKSLTPQGIEEMRRKLEELKSCSPQELREYLGALNAANATRAARYGIQERVTLETVVSKCFPQAVALLRPLDKKLTGSDALAWLANNGLVAKDKLAYARHRGIGHSVEGFTSGKLFTQISAEGPIQAEIKDVGRLCLARPTTDGLSRISRTSATTDLDILSGNCATQILRLPATLPEEVISTIPADLLSLRSWLLINRLFEVGLDSDKLNSLLSEEAALIGYLEGNYSTLITKLFSANEQNELSSLLAKSKDPADPRSISYVDIPPAKLATLLCLAAMTNAHAGQSPEKTKQFYSILASEIIRRTAQAERIAQKSPQTVIDTFRIDEALSLFSIIQKIRPSIEIELPPGYVETIKEYIHYGLNVVPYLHEFDDFKIVIAALKGKIEYMKEFNKKHGPNPEFISPTTGLKALSLAALNELDPRYINTICKYCEGFDYPAILQGTKIDKWRELIPEARIAKGNLLGQLVEKDTVKKRFDGFKNKGQLIKEFLAAALEKKQTEKDSDFSRRFESYFCDLIQALRPCTLSDLQNQHIEILIHQLFSKPQEILQLWQQVVELTKIEKQLKSANEIIEFLKKWDRKFSEGEFDLFEEKLASLSVNFQGKSPKEVQQLVRRIYELLTQIMIRNCNNIQELALLSDRYNQYDLFKEIQSLYRTDEELGISNFYSSHQTRGKLANTLKKQGVDFFKDLRPEILIYFNTPEQKINPARAASENPMKEKYAKEVGLNPNFDWMRKGCEDRRAEVFLTLQQFQALRKQERGGAAAR